MRAGAMGGIGLLALAVGSRSAPMNALALALIIVLAFRPALVHSVGLHMSAAATARDRALGPPPGRSATTLASGCRPCGRSHDRRSGRGRSDRHRRLRAVVVDRPGGEPARGTRRCARDGTGIGRRRRGDARSCPRLARGPCGRAVRVVDRDPGSMAGRGVGGRSRPVVGGLGPAPAGRTPRVGYRPQNAYLGR